MTVPKTVRLGLLCGVTALGLPQPLMALQTSVPTTPAPQCKATIEGHAFPGRITTAVPIGLGGTGYSATGLVTPELIPMGVEANDDDEWHAHCDGICAVIPSCSDYDVDWTATATGDPGGFADENANLSPTLNGYWHVLYLPPNDLAIGDTRIVSITATASDLCDEASDPPSIISIQVTVTRNPDRADPPNTPQFDVAVVVISIVDPVIAPPVCDATSEQLCELLGPSLQIAPPPTGGISAAPTGMIVGETRPLDSNPADMDTASMECGTPPGHQPVVSNFAQELICDCFASYSWSVVAGPGNGVFVRQGRTALFRATVPGSVTVRLVARTSDGEVIQDDRTFQIHAPILKGVEFDDNEDVARDFDGATYDGYDWYDNDGDGLATTPDLGRSNGANLAGDRRFPLAYVRGTVAAPKRVKVAKVAIDCTVKPMPGATVRGEIAGLPAEQFVGGWKPGTPTTHLFAEDMTGRQLIPDFVGWIPSLAIRWDVTWDSQNIIQTGSCENTYYFVRATPAMPPPTGGGGAWDYKPFESFFDIGCRAQAGSAVQATVISGVWSAMSQKFGPSMIPRTARKIIDGHLNLDGRTMNYWSGSTPGSCQSVSQMLAHPNGNGACGSWSQLLRGSLAVHGVASQVFRVNPPAGRSHLMVNNWREVIPQAPGNPWTIPAHVTELDVNGQPVTGVAGQDNLVPPKFFNLHYIVQLGGVFYDPSYGSATFATGAIYEDAAFWGFRNGLVQGFKNVAATLEAAFIPTNL